MTGLRRLHDEDKGKVRTTKIRKISLRRRRLVVSSRDVGVAVMAPRRDDGKKMVVDGGMPRKLGCDGANSELIALHGICACE
jgi:hypothetical protein